MNTGLEFRILGPLEVRRGGTLVHVGGPRQRALLALLLCYANRVVSRDELVEELLRDQPTEPAERMLRVQISRLRKVLADAVDGPSRLLTRPPGYLLRVGDGELDLDVFEERVAAGRDALSSGDPGRAAALLSEAGALWRGRPLADLEFEPFARFEIQRLDAGRLVAVEDRIEAELALGHHATLCPELGKLVAEHPLRERLRGQLMLALYRSGCQAEALAVFQDTRRVLDAELGIEPGPGLRRLHEQVLATDPLLDPPAPAPVAGAAVPGGRGPAGAAVRFGPVEVVPRQLPAGIRFFAGREAELKVLDELLGRAGGEGGAVMISAVAGMAGVGKTALAVHWARRVAGRFPDGQLYVNLRGYGPGAAVAPEEAAGWFLVGLGVPAVQVPAEAQARYGLYRSVLAARRVLIVLDNAADAAQVRPLLPGDGGCLVVVTSRSALAGLAAAEGTYPLRLGPLTGEEAVRLLAARLGPERITAEPEAATELVARCGGLPLALAVMAARAAADPGLPLRALAAQLARASDAEAVAVGQPPDGEGTGRLEVLETGDAATSLLELLSWSHRQLPEPAAGMLALLGVHCGPDITVSAAASLAGVPHVDAGRSLAELADASLVTEHRPGRHVMHDLVRAYAAGQARHTLGESGIREAIGRSLDYYLHTMVSCPDIPWRVTPARPAPGVAPEQLTDEEGLADWAQAEDQVLLQATAQAAAASFLTHAWQIFTCQAFFLGGQGWYWADFRAIGQAMLAATEAAGDQAALGWTHAIMGWYCTFTGAHGEDRGHQSQALDIFRQTGDLPGQGCAHLLAARPAARDGDWAHAVTHCEQALALFRQTGDGVAQRWALAALGECQAHLGNYDLARGCARQALELGPQPGDPTSLARSWHVLGLVHSRLGEHVQAMDCYRQALALAQQRKTPLARWWLASLLASLGDACQAAGDLPAARQAWQQALHVLDDLGLPANRRIRARLEQPTHRARPDHQAHTPVAFPEVGLSRPAISDGTPP